MSFCKGFKKGFHLFGQTTTTIVNFVLLLFTYFIGIGLTTLVTKLMGKQMLMLKLEPKKKTYWLNHAKVSDNIEDYYRQF